MTSKGQRVLDKRDGEAGSRPRLRLLNPHALSERCRRGHFPPPDDLAPFVAVTCTLAWELHEDEGFEQRVLPDPSAQIIVEPGGALLWGVVTGAFSTVIKGTGFVLGMKFHPGGLCAFVKRPMAEFTDKRVALPEVFAGADSLELHRLAAAEDGTGIRGVLEAVLRQAGPIPHGRIQEVQEITKEIARDPSLVNVAQVSRVCGMNLRALQRLFRNYVGVSPKWMIRRYRLQEAAARIEAGAVENWADLAQRLGYFDQGHFIREFRRMVGQPPAEYVKRMLD
jgi:AraC-like DNA-binding protein